MKKVNLFLALALVFANLFLTPAAQGEGTRKLTLMVYMCGSNLESSCGSATEDIQEMLASMPASRELSVLVLTGGSDMPPGAGYFGQENTGIYELASNNRIRRVAEPDGQNMGDGATLAGFLRWGRENRPADRYALIVWNHGGGPLEGVCWDETADMDNLTLTELTGALEEALDQKLDWIGFDACLMGSLEVAGMLAPYADYMIASQEMEPSFGWNYGFLRDLPGDADGAETGRRIVDAFFEGKEDSTEILTLACIDLAAAGEAIDALDPVFLPLSGSLDEESYLALSARRMTTSGFGKAEPGFSATGYDLVDAMDLAESLAEPEESEETTALIDKLNRAVVYSRANEEGANGLTLYYPYANKESYLEKWKDGYAELSFSPGYQAYVEAFGRLLTGDALFRWLNLIPDPGVAEADGTYSFSMPLTEEQAENAVSAQLLILRDLNSSRMNNDCVEIAACKAEIGPDGVVRATWDGHCLYAEEEDGSLTGPVSFRQTDDGKSNAVIAYYNSDDQNALIGQTVFMILDAEDTSEYPEVLRIQIWDEATQSFSSRLSYSEEGYFRVYFWNLNCKYPGTGEDQVLPDFWEWETSAGVNVKGFALPQDWLLRSVRADSGEQYYAVFRLLDSQQQAVCSVPVEVPNPYRTVSLPASGGVDTPEVRLDLACTADTSPDGFGLHLEWTIENRREEKIGIRIKQPTLNDSRITEDLMKTAAPGRTVHPDAALTVYDTAFLETLESVSGTLVITAESGDVQEIPFRFVFDKVDLSSLQPQAQIAEITQDDIVLHLFEYRPDRRSGLVLSILAENGSSADFQPSYISLNGIGFSTLGSPAVPSGKSRAMELNAVNSASSLGLKIAGSEYIELTYLEDWLLQSLGIHEVSSLDIWAYTGGEQETRFTINPAEPIPLADPVPVHDMGQDYPVINPPEDLELPQQDQLPVIAQNKDMRLYLRRAAADGKTISLSVETVNLSDRWVKPEITGVFINGRTVPGYNTVWRAIPPGMTVVRELDVTLPDGQTNVEKIELTLQDSQVDYPKTASARLAASEPIPVGQEGGAWVNGDRFTADEVFLPDYEPEDPDTEPTVMVRTLEIPDNVYAYRTLIDTGISPEEAEGIEFCRTAVVRKSDGGYLQIVTMQDMLPNEDGRVIIDHPGLLTTVAGFPEFDVAVRFRRAGEGTVTGEVIVSASAITRNGDFIWLDNISWSLDREANTAEISSFEQTQPLERQADLSSATITTLEILPEPLEDGTLPFIGSMAIRDDMSWYLKIPSIRLEGKPLQLALRPVTKDDDLYILVSVKKKDGTGYSLPLIPFPVKEN